MTDTPEYEPPAVEEYGDIEALTEMGPNKVSGNQDMGGSKSQV